MPSIVLHSRQIPAEHLKASSLGAFNRQILTTLTPENLRVLKSRGVSTMELRLVWWEIEPEPGRFDWSRFERDLEMLERHGLKAGLMAWFNHRMPGADCSAGCGSRLRGLGGPNAGRRCPRLLRLPAQSEGRGQTLRRPGGGQQRRPGRRTAACGSHLGTHRRPVVLRLCGRGAAPAAGFQACMTLISASAPAGRASKRARGTVRLPSASFVYAQGRPLRLRPAVPAPLPE